MDVPHVPYIETGKKSIFAAPPKLNLVVLRSPDMHRAATFYSALGLLFVPHRHGSGPEHYVSEVCGLVFEIYPATEKSPSTSSTRIGFNVDSVDQLVPMLTKIGAVIITPPHDSEWGRRAVVKDLDGAVREHARRAIRDFVSASELGGHTDYGRALRQFHGAVGAELERRSTVLIFGDARGNYLPAEEATLATSARPH